MLTTGTVWSVEQPADGRRFGGVVGVVAGPGEVADGGGPGRRGWAVAPVAGGGVGMIVTLASVRGSPGVTSWALLVAAAWPAAVDAERVVVEADLDGGVLGARYGLGVDPGVVSLIAALRRSEGLAVPVEEHGRPVGCGAVAGARPGVERAGPLSLGRYGSGRGGPARRRRPAVAGRRRAGARRLGDVAAGATFAADGGGVPVRARRTSSRCRPASSALRAHCRDVGVLVVGKAPYTSGELVEFFGTPAVWRVGACGRSPGAGRRGAVAWPGSTLVGLADGVGRGGADRRPRPCRVARSRRPERERSPCRQRGGRQVNRPDPVLLIELTRSVQNALVADATARLQSGRARLGRGGQEALADKVLRQELQRIDTDRLSTGAPRLTADEERTLVERVLALSVGLGPSSCCWPTSRWRRWWRPASTWCSSTGPTARSSRWRNGCGRPRRRWSRGWRTWRAPPGGPSGSSTARSRCW